MNKNLIYIKSNLSDFKKRYILCLLLVCSFGIYKNIICLINTDISLIYLITKAIYLILGFGFGTFVDSLKNKKITFSFNSISGLMLAMIVPFNTSIVLFILCLGLLLFLSLIDKNDNINKISIIKIFLIVTMIIIGNYNYLNPLEMNNEYTYTLLDNFIGNQVGAIFSTSVLLILISLILLSENKIYKTKIAILSICSYIFTLILLLLTKEYMNIFMLMQNSLNIFTFVFIAPFSIYSPYKNKEIYIYSIFIGICSALISYFIFPYEGAIISTLLANIILIIWNKLHKSTKSAQDI